jgi:hypothetical protein
VISNAAISEARALVESMVNESYRDYEMTFSKITHCTGHGTTS